MLKPNNAGEEGSHRDCVEIQNLILFRFFSLKTSTTPGWIFGFDRGSGTVEDPKHLPTFLTIITILQPRLSNCTSKNVMPQFILFNRKEAPKPFDYDELVL